MSRSSNVLYRSLSKQLWIFALVFCFLSPIHLLAQSNDYFDQLTSDRKPILGSEKEDKYTFRFPPFASVENWGPHYSVHALLFSYTNYPKFKEVSFFPVYNNLWAKESDSSKSYLFPFFYSQKIEKNDGISGFHLSLLHYRSFESGTNFAERAIRFPSFLPLAGSHVSVLNGKESSFRYAVPFLFFQQKDQDSDWTHFLLLHWGKNENSSYGAVLPLLFWGSGQKRSHLSFFPFWFYDKDNETKERKFLTPLFGRTWKERGEGENFEEDRFTYFLPFFRASFYKNGELQSSHSILPIVWNRQYNKAIGTSTNAFLFSGWSSGLNGEYKSSYLFPFLFHKKGEYFHFVPAYFDFGTEKFGVLPLPFYYQQNATQTKFYILNTYYSNGWNGERKFLFFPLFYRLWNGSETTTIAPLYYRNTEGESSKNYLLNTYLSWNKKGELDRAVFFPFIFYKPKEYFFFFPLFYRSLGDSETTTIAPLYYRNSEGESSKNYFLNTYLSWEKKGELDRAVFFPFVYYKANDYFYFFPLYFDTGKARFGLLPLPFYYGDDLYQKKVYALNMYYTSNRAGESSFLFFPLWYNAKTQIGNTILAPFYYRHSEGGSSENYALNTYFSWDRTGELEKGIFFPFVFYKADEYLSVLPFVVKGNRPGGEYTLLPALLTYWDKDRTWILNTYLSKDSQTGEYKQFTFFPFWSYNKEKETRSYLLFPFFHHRTTENTSRTISLLSYSYKTPEEDYSLYFLYEKYDSKTKSTRRIYPFFFSGSDDQGSYWNLAGLAGRGFDKLGEAEYSYVLPFLYFYKRNSYRLSLPFFIRLGYDNTHYTHFGIFHYWNRSPEKNNTWIWPLLWFSNIDTVRKEDFITWFPLYWNWNTPRSKGDIFIPFYMNYEEADKSLQLVLAYSYSQSLGSFGSSAALGSTEKEYYIDTDLGIFYNLFSISKRTSIPKEQLFWWREQHPKEDTNPVVSVLQEEKPKAQEKDGINRYNRLTRENVKSFWGVSALFGIFSYEEGDDRRHLRLLPLSWFSWSKKTDEKVYAAPFFFWSRIADESYFVLFPFYARQDQGTDYLESYLLLGFLRGKQGETKDYSFLWPITRFYTSPDSWGFRIFPLLAHDQSIDHSRTISPLYYRKRIKEGETTSYSFHSIAIPLIHSYSELVLGKEGAREESYDTFLPFYFRFYSYEDGKQRKDEKTTVYTLLSKYDTRRDSDGRSVTSFISPFYYFRTLELTRDSEVYTKKVDFLLIPGLYWERSPDNSTFFLLGYYKHRSETLSESSFLGLVSSSESRIGTKTNESFRAFPFYFSSREKEGEQIMKSSTTIPILYHTSQDGESKTWNVLGILNGSKSFSVDSFAIYPFYSNTSEKNPNFQTQTIWGIPYFHTKSEHIGGYQKSFSLNPFGIFTSTGSKTSASETESSFWFLPIPALYFEKSVSPHGIVERELSFLKFITYKSTEDIRSGKMDKREFSALLFISTKSDSYESGTGKVSLFQSYIFPLYWYTKERNGDSNRTHLNFLVIFDYANEYSTYESKNGKGVKEFFRAFPFYFSSQEKEGDRIVRSSTTIPIFYHASQDENGKEWNVLGFLNGSLSNTEDSFAIYPFYSNTNKKDANLESHTIWGIPYYYDRSEYAGGNWNSFALNPFGVFSAGKYDNKEFESKFFFLPIPALYYEKETTALGIVDREWNFLKLIRYNSTEDIRSGKTDKREFSAFFLISGKSSSYEGESGKVSNFQSYFFPLFWYNRENVSNANKTHLNFLILFDYANDSSSKESRWIVGPFFNFSKPNAHAWGFFPLLFGEKAATYNVWFALGAYGYSDSDSSRWGFAGIVDTSYENSFKRRNLNLFLGLIHAELEEQKTKVAILGGWLGGYESRPNYSDANFLWLGWTISPERTLLNFIPLFRYHSDPEGTSTLIPPVLGYFSSDKDGRFDLLAGGLMYFRYQSISKEEDWMFVGPGLFYYRRYKNHENGLNAMGILALPAMGGLLWDWEYETKTKYSRYSILNILYSHTTRKDGTEFNRILGIKF